MSAAMASMTAATMTAALTNMAQMSNMPQMAPLPTITNKPQMAPLPTITNKPPPSQVPQTTLPPLNLDHIEEVKRKVTQQANIYSIKELTEKCKMIAASKEEMAIAKPHVSDDEDEDRKPRGKSFLS